MHPFVESLNKEQKKSYYLIKTLRNGRSRLSQVRSWMMPENSLVDQAMDGFADEEVELAKDITWEMP